MVAFKLYKWNLESTRGLFLFFGKCGCCSGFYTCTRCTSNDRLLLTIDWIAVWGLSRLHWVDHLLRDLFSGSNSQWCVRCEWMLHRGVRGESLPWAAPPLHPYRLHCTRYPYTYRLYCTATLILIHMQGAGCTILATLIQRLHCTRYYPYTYTYRLHCTRYPYTYIHTGHKAY